MDCGSIGFLSLHTLNVDDVLLPVHLHHFANLLAFVVSTDNLFVNNNAVKQMHLALILLMTNVQQSILQYLDFIVFTDGHGPHIVLLAELFGQRGRHDLPPDVWGGIEVPLAILTAGGGYKWIQLHDASSKQGTFFVSLGKPQFHIITLQNLLDNYLSNTDNLNPASTFQRLTWS